MIQTSLQTNHINNNQPALKRKTYVLDTTVLINDPNIVSKLKGRAVVPLVVIGQLDGLKNNENTTVAQRARQASRAILEAQEKGKVRVINNFKKGVDVLGSEADNKIIGTCLTLKEQGENVNLLTTDVNMQITARSMGMKTIDAYENSRKRKAKIWKIITISLLLICIIFLICITICEVYNYKKNEFFEYLPFCMLISFVTSFITSAVASYYSDRRTNDAHRDDYDIVDDPFFSDSEWNVWHKD